MPDRFNDWTLGMRLAVGFVAGALAAVLCHQAMLALLYQAGWAITAPYSMAPTAPFGVPRTLSLMFWGGVWGMIFIHLQARAPRGLWYWLFVVFLGALMLSMANWFVWSPLKGNPIAAGWQPPRMRVGILVNGAWGLGTAILIRWASYLPNLVPGGFRRA
jgi:hypothetical protein